MKSKIRIRTIIGFDAWTFFFFWTAGKRHDLEYFRFWFTKKKKKENDLGT